MVAVTLINPNVNPVYGTLAYFPPLGLLYIASYLRNDGHTVNFVDADNLGLNHEDILEVVRKNDSTVVGISCMTTQLQQVYDLASFLKRANPNYIIIVGGPHPSAMPVQTLQECSDIDIAVIGEGEITFSELVGRIGSDSEYSDLKGIASRVNGEVVLTTPREFISDIDALPIPAYDLVESFLYYPGTSPSKEYPSMYVMGSRGCPFTCSFCSDAIWKRTLRKRDPQKIIDEAELLITKYGIKELYFQDDTFNVDKTWFSSICNEIIKRGLHKKCTFKCPMRANKNIVTDELFSLAKKANFWMVFFGVESGSQKVLNEVCKSLTKEEISRAFAIARKWGIQTYASFMVGNYPEDQETVAESIAFAKEIKPDYAGAALLIPYPGTPVYRQMAEESRITRSFPEFRIGEESFNHPRIPEGEMQRTADHLNQVLADLTKKKGVQVPNMLPLKRSKVSVRLSAGELPGSVTPGEMFQVQVMVSNDGSEALRSLQPNPVHLSYHWKDARGGVVQFEGMRTALKPMVLPGMAKKIHMSIIAPGDPGMYQLEITMVQEGVFWFEKILRNFPYTVGCRVV